MKKKKTQFRENDGITRREILSGIPACINSKLAPKGYGYVPITMTWTHNKSLIYNYNYNYFSRFLKKKNYFLRIMLK